MEEKFDTLNCFEQYPLEYSQEQQMMPEFLAGMISNADDLFRSKKALEKEREALEAHVVTLQATAKDFTSQLQRERELRVKFELELEVQKQMCAEYKDQMLNNATIMKQSEATFERDVKREVKKYLDLLQEVTKAYFVQYEYLRNRRAFAHLCRIKWPLLNQRIHDCEGLQEIYNEHAARMKTQPTIVLKDMGTMCRPVMKATGTSTEKEEEEQPREIVRVSSGVEMGTNTEAAMEVERITVRTVEIGVNTTAANRVTRATQATEKKTQTVDRSSLCLLLESPPEVVQSEEESVDLEEIFKSTICEMPDVLEEITELVVPMISSACQTEDNSESTASLTELYNVSRRIDYKSRKERRRPVEQMELMKSELNGEGFAMKQFEQYWSLAGQSLIGMMMKGHSAPEMPMLTGMDFLLQQQMVSKFLGGPVKKAVSIPSVYAESTKSGFEREVDDEEFNVGESSSGRRSEERRNCRAFSEESTMENKYDEIPSPIPEERRNQEEETPAREQFLEPEVRKKSNECPKKRQVINRTVSRIMRERSTAFKIRPTGEKRRSVPPRKSPVQLKKIRLVKQKEEVPENSQEKLLLDIFGPEENEENSEDNPGTVDHQSDVEKVAKLSADLFLSDSEEEVEVEEKEESQEMIVDEKRPELDNEMEMEANGAKDETVPQIIDSKISETNSVEMEEGNNKTVQLLDDLFDSPASPPPNDRFEDENHKPKEIPKEVKIISKNPELQNRCMKNLKITHTTLNQFIQNYTPLKDPEVILKRDETKLQKILHTYLDTEWSPESVTECVNELTNCIAGQSGRKLALVKIILKTMEHCTDDLQFEPFLSLAPFMPKTHQMVVLVVDRLQLGEKMIAEIEQRLFTFKSDSIKMSSVINWTYLYLTLQDLEINKNQRAPRPLRLFIVKALYYLKRRSVAIVFMTLKAFPKLLPRFDRDTPFRVGEYLDPLVDVIVCVLMHSTECNAGRPSADGDTKLLAKYRADWKKLHGSYYGYKQFQPTPVEVLAMLLDRLRQRGKETNVVHGILLLAKHMDVSWTENELLEKELLPRVNELLDETTSPLSAETDHQLCLYLTVIAGVVKVFPRTNDVSVYRNIFRKVLEEKQRFSHQVQECAVVSILRLAAFGVESTFNSIRSWYAEPQNLSSHLRAVMETFVRRNKPQYWVNLSNQV